MLIDGSCDGNELEEDDNGKFDGRSLNVEDDGMNDGC